MNTSDLEWIEPFRNHIVLRNVEPRDTERLEEFFKRELDKGGHRSVCMPLSSVPRHRKNTDDALLAVSVPGKHKKNDWELMAKLGVVMKHVSRKTGKPVLIQSKIKNSRDFESPS